MINSETFGNTYFTFIHEIHDTIFDTIYPSEKYVDEPYRFYYTILHKLATVGDALAFLTVNLDGKPHYCDSAGILVRTCMLDLVCLYYVIDKTELPEQQNRIENILYDHVRTIYSKTDNPEEKTKIRQQFEQCFDGEKFKKSIQKISTKSMVDNISIETFAKEAGRALTIYNYFSKIEHNGIFTFNLMHRHYNPESNVTKEIIYDAILLKAMVILVVIQHWISKDDHRYIKLKSLYREMATSNKD